MTPALLMSRSMRSCSDGVEAGQVELGDLDLSARRADLDRTAGILALCLVAAGQDRPRALARQLASGHETQAAVGSGHHRHTPALIRYPFRSPFHRADAIRLA